MVVVPHGGEKTDRRYPVAIPKVLADLFRFHFSVVRPIQKKYVELAGKEWKQGLWVSDYV